MTSTTPIKRRLLRAAQYGGIVLVTLALVDLVCMAFGLFPPVYEYGEPDVGWVSSPPTGAMHVDRCVEFSTGDTITYLRNEDGVRTSLHAADLVASQRGRHIIGVTGDSQTDLCAPNEQTHPGVLERTLRARGVPTVVVAYGAGRYSPLQDYIVFKKVLTRYAPDVFVLNLYTGNDFYDILRVDDRPHFVHTDTGYAIAPPVWYRYDAPGLRRRSRVLYVIRSLAKRSGLLDLVQRVQMLLRSGEPRASLRTIVAYMNDLRRSTDPSVGYSAAFTAQMLNQQLYFHYFPEGHGESLRRVQALLELVHRENPGLVILLSPLPSYQLAQQQPVDSALLRVLARLPLTYDGGVREEQALYDTLRVLAGKTGWLFADNLAALRAYRGSERLYNGFDYHLLPVASALVGRTEAEVLALARSSLMPASAPWTSRARCCVDATPPPAHLKRPIR